MGSLTTDHDSIFTDLVNRQDGLVMPAVKDRDLTAPPGSPADGDVYLVAAGATGDWAGHDDEIAHYWSGWLFTSPREGFRLWVEDEDLEIYYDGSAWQLAPVFENLYVGGFKNKIINGSFDIWQRGTSFLGVSTNAYTASRWQMNPSGGIMDITQQSFALGQTDVPGEPEFFFRFECTAADDSVGVIHKVEGVRTLAGETCTLSLYAKADTTRTFKRMLRQYFGTGGAPSGDVDLDNVSDITLSTGWQKFTANFDLASISGKTMGTDENDYLSLFLVNPNNETFTIDIAQVQLELGPAATAFEHRSIGQELALCKWYYQKSYNLDTDPGTVTDVGAVRFRAHGTTHLQPIEYEPMRANPTTTRYNPATGATGTWRDQSASNNLTASASNVGENRCNVAITSSVDLNAMNGHWTADSEL